MNAENKMAQGATHAATTTNATVDRLFDFLFILRKGKARHMVLLCMSKRSLYVGDRRMVLRYVVWRRRGVLGIEHHRHTVWRATSSLIVFSNGVWPLCCVCLASFNYFLQAEHRPWELCLPQPYAGET